MERCYVLCLTHARFVSHLRSYEWVGERLYWIHICRYMVCHGLHALLSPQGPLADLTLVRCSLEDVRMVKRGRLKSDMVIP